MTRIIDQILEVSIGRKDGVAVLNMMKMLHFVDEGGMFHMMMALLCINPKIVLLAKFRSVSNNQGYNLGWGGNVWCLDKLGLNIRATPLFFYLSTFLLPNIIFLDSKFPVLAFHSRGMWLNILIYFWTRRAIWFVFPFWCVQQQRLLARYI